ncbi:hypothetical protein ABZ815_37750 [Nonomuraea sp. NPDC047529]|uniref:hypothetical protein n=1 Tax=Nonomuraea sp. NPDC047529 TaxID=3155623 RepID=UPI00340D3A73
MKQFNQRPKRKSTRRWPSPERGAGDQVQPGGAQVRAEDQDSDDEGTVAVVEETAFVVHQAQVIGQEPLSTIEPLTKTKRTETVVVETVVAKAADLVKLIGVKTPEELQKIILRPRLAQAVAEEAVLYFATEGRLGDWPKLLRLWAECTEADREKVLNTLPDVVIQPVFTQMVDTYVEAMSKHAEPDYFDISAAFEVTIDEFSLQASPSLDKEAAPGAVGKAIVLGPPNVFATKDGRMIDVPTPAKPGNLYTHPSDEVLETMNDVSGVNLPTTVTLTAKNELWLGGGPSPDDVRQGELGDCFLLSLLGAIAQHDPDHIRRMVKKDDDTYVVTFTRTIKDKNQEFRVPQQVKLDTLIFPHSNQNALLGARARVQIGGPVHRRRRTLGADDDPGNEYLEKSYKLRTAMWVPIVERAYAVLAGAHGLFADKESSDEDVNGYVAISNGSVASHAILSCLYGHRFRRSGSVQVTNLNKSISRPPGSLDRPSSELFNLLLMVGHQAANPSPCLAIPTAAISWRDVGGQLVDLFRKQLGDARLDDFERLDPHLAVIVEKLETAIKAGEEGLTPLESDAKFQDACAAVIKDLLPRRSEAPWASRVVKLLAALAPPVSMPASQPYLFARHAYMIGAVDLQPAGNWPAPDYETNPARGGSLNNLAAMATALSTLDTRASTITLINPHHKNSPNLDKKLDAATDTGTFRLTLAEFLGFFTQVDYGIVSRDA